MRYVPNLIPKDVRVLPNYFKGSLHPAGNKGNANIIYWITGILFLIIALVHANHFPLLFLFGLIALILLPVGHLWLQKKLRCRLESKIRIVVGAATLICAIPLTAYYGGVDRQVAEQVRLAAEKEAKQKAAAAALEQQRKDSVSVHLQASSNLRQANKLTEAENELHKAAQFATAQEDKDRLKNEDDSIAVRKVTILIASGHYESAIDELDAVIQRTNGNGNLYYSRAICYSHTGKIEQAVEDCKTASAMGNEAADKLHDKINPVRKRITGYMTLCCDGSFSYAKGRGACSHHGGVCNWNYPVYEEYRKYE